MKTVTLMRLRASRFVSTRYRQRERGYLAEFVLWGVVMVIAVVWPWIPLVDAMETMK